MMAAGMRRLTQDELRAVIRALMDQEVMFESGARGPTFKGERLALGSARAKFQRDYERRVIQRGNAAPGKTLTEVGPVVHRAPLPLSPTEQSLALRMGLQVGKSEHATSLRKRRA